MTAAPDFETATVSVPVDVAVVPVADVAVVREFLAHFYRDAEDGVLVLNHDTDRWQSLWFAPDRLDDMAAAAVALRPKTGVYYPIASRVEELPGGARGGVKDCREVFGVVADIDIKGPQHPGNYPPTQADALGLLRDFPLRPTFIIDTGNGVQAGWLLAEPVAAADAEDTVRRFGVTWRVIGQRHQPDSWKIDNVGGVERVFRLPGTLNAKTSPPKPVTVIEANWDRRYSLDDLDEVTLDEPTPPSPPRSPNRPGIPLGDCRPGDDYNARHTPDEVLLLAGCVYSHTSRGDGRRHFYVPTRAESREQTGVTVYPDPGGDHAVIWSETFATQLGVAPRASVDAFGLFARLFHAANWTVAARAADAEVAGVTSPSATEPTDVADPPVMVPFERLPEEFWTARPVFEHVRQAARSRGVAPDAAFGVVLVRIAAMTSPRVFLPGLVGSTSSLSVYVALIGESGTGKSTCREMGEELLPCDSPTVDSVVLGSGEGLVDAFLEANEKKVKVQTKTGVIAILDEGEALTDLAKRSGSTLMSTLRTVWTGGEVGARNASRDTRRHLSAKTYNIGLLAGFQPGNARGLLDDVGGGTPQRFEYLTTYDPDLPDEWPRWPGEMTWTPPTPAGVGSVPFALRVADEIRKEVQRNRTLTTRRLLKRSPLDSHYDLGRLKVAALLAILDGRTDVSVQDWALAGMFKRTSAVVRAGIVGHLAAEERQREQASTSRAVRRDAALADSAEARIVERCARTLARAVHAGGRVSRSDAWRKIAYRDRKEVTIDDVVRHAVGLAWIAVDGDTLKPGTAVPK